MSGDVDTANGMLAETLSLVDRSAKLGVIHGNEPFGPPAVMDLQASLDGDGQVIDWRHEVFSCSHIGRPRPTPGYSNMQAAWLRANA